MTVSVDTRIIWFDAIIKWLLVALLAFMPLAFGVVEAWSEEVVIAVSGLIIVCFLLKLVFYCDVPLVWTWAYVPVGLFVLLVALQLTPLPASLVGFVSPNTQAIRAEFLSDLPNAGEFLKFTTLSFYPNATKHDLRLILAVTAVFVVVLNVFRRPGQIEYILAAIAVIGGAIALLALAQDFFGNGKIYWLVSTRSNLAHSGSFVNHSNYSQFANLSIGAAIGLIFAKLHKLFNGRKITPSIVLEYLRSPAGKSIWYLLVAVVMGAAAVFVSLTRGGIISMVIAAGFTTFVVTFTSRHHLKGSGWIMVFIMIVTFTCLLCLGFDVVYDRLATLRNIRQIESGRWQRTKDMALAWTKFPVFGTGLGTHEFVHPMFDRSNYPQQAGHGENEYAQIAEETGLVGVGALVVFAVIVWRSYAYSIRSARAPIQLAAYGLGFGLLAILIHSLGDFGQRLPANACLSAVSCGIIVGFRRIGRTGGLLPGGFRRGSVRAVRVVAVISVILVWTWALLGAGNARIADGHWKKALAVEKTLVERNWQGTDTGYADLISHAVKASSYQPENIKYRHWLNVYRWRSISRHTDPETGAIIIPKESMQLVHHIVDEFYKAIQLCPTYGQAYSLLGQLERFVLDDDAGAEKIRKSFRLASCDPTVCFIAGYLDVLEGKTLGHIEKFKRAVELNNNLFKNVVDIYINQLDRADLAVLIAGDDIDRLSQLAKVLGRMDGYEDLTKQVRERVKDLLEAECCKSDATAQEFASLANIYRTEQRNEAAIEHYRRALALDYSQAHWRFRLAKLLADAGHITDAMHEARICLRLRPQLKDAKKLVAELSLHPDILKQAKDLP